MNNLEYIIVRTYLLIGELPFSLFPCLHYSNNTAMKTKVQETLQHCAFIFFGLGHSSFCNFFGRALQTVLCNNDVKFTHLAIAHIYSFFIHTISKMN